MHIVDGALSDPVVIGGGVLTVLGVAYGLKQIDAEKIPQTGILSATFFIASLIHIPLGPSSVHLILNGLLGLTLGWAAFPALLIALLLQAVFFGYGGFVVLGVNVLNIALPAILMGVLCRRMVMQSKPRTAAIWGAIAGGGAILLTALFVAGSLALSGEEFLPAAKLVILSHLPVVVVEALLTGAAVLLIRRVRPDFFGEVLDE